MNPVADVDDRVMRAIAEHRVDWMTILARDVMWAGTIVWSLLAIGLVLLVVVAVLGAWRVAGVVVAAVLLASAVVAVLKEVFERARPPSELALLHVAGYSMPSSEAARTAAASTALVLVVAWASRRRLVACASVLVAANLFVGWCIVYLGGHWPSDVVIGWVLGATVGACVGMTAARFGGPWTVGRSATAEVVP